MLDRITAVSSELQRRTRRGLTWRVYSGSVNTAMPLARISAAW